MKSKYWVVIWLLLVGLMLFAIAGLVCYVDPYFHYHKPNTESFFYPLNNQRSQNDGITKHFEYDAIITGTSMTENFKASELDEIFNVSSVKVSYSGGKYKEINDNLKIAFDSNSSLRTVIRCLDYDYMLDDKDEMRTDMGSFPTYLYDNNPLNDVQYLFNKDVIFGRIYGMIADKRKDGFKPGITSFDQYSRWQEKYTFGTKTVLDNSEDYNPSGNVIHLSEDDKQRLYGNITQNVTSLADEHPEATFYYFLSPYSIAFWIEHVNDGSAYRLLEAEEYVIKLILKHKNIKLFSFNGCAYITTNLDNYKDVYHYGERINSFMLKAMHDERYLITEDNYKAYISQVKKLYLTYDYNLLMKLKYDK